MNNYQKARLSAYKLIVAEAKKAALSVSKIAKFEKAIAELEEIINKIEALQTQQEKDTTGITANMRQLIDQLIDMMAEIAGALQSHANEKGDKEIAEKVNFTENSLSSMRKQDLISACSLLIEEIAKLSAEELVTEGISAEEVAELKKLHESVKEKQQSPQMAIIDQSNYTENLRKLFERASNIKKNTLDMLVRQFKRKDPDFHQRYLTASKVVYKKASRKSNGNGSLTMNEIAIETAK